ncbi:energy-coupling factor transporter ATPase [Peptococcus simiae]|uniref:energy-coupling factor transporter ATPase n=1 Tax=Peptococcus simiae TaxID=1643805 RepID=UPI00397ED764
MIMIEVRQLVHRYANADPAQPDALAGVSLQVSPGEYLAVLGRNGCGKSTLAKHLNALLLPTEGEVLVDGLNTKDPDLTLAIRQKVGMVFQNPDNQLVATTVMEDVAFGPENLGLPREEILKRIDEALARVRMTDFKEAEPHHLSGGQKQRVAIAGVLAMEPDYIVFDEPTAMLDPRGREEILATMLELKAAGIGVVNITHYMEEAVPADRVLVMTGGEIVLEGRPREIFSQVETLKDLHLDVPVVTELAQLLYDDCPWLARDILTPEEMVEALCP